MGQTEHCPNDGGARFVLPKTIDKAAIDFDPVEFEGKKLAERRVARTEIIKRNSYARLPQLSSHGLRGLHIIDERGLGDFQLKPPRAKAGLRQNRKYT